MATVKLQDIAHICGFDLSTVSRGLRNDPRVKAATRKRIQKTAERLGYRPNLLARNLAGGKTHTIWLILPSLDASIDHRLVSKASHYANKKGYTLFAALHDSDIFGELASNSTEHYENIVQMAAQGTTDGVLVIPRRGMNDLPVLKKLVDRNFPLVFLDNIVDGLPCPAITTNNQAASAELTRRCAQDGITGAILVFEEPNPISQARLASAKATLKSLGIPYAVPSDLPKHQIMKTLGNRVAVIGSSQVYNVHKLLAKHSAALADKKLLFAVFDEWYGEPMPAEKVFIVVQDSETMAKRAIDRLLLLIENQPSPQKYLEQIPIAEILEKTGTLSP